MAYVYVGNRVNQVKSLLLDALEVPDQERARTELAVYAKTVAEMESDFGGRASTVFALQERKSLLQASGKLTFEEAMTLYRWLNEWDTIATVERLATMLVIAKAGQ